MQKYKGIIVSLSRFETPLEALEAKEEFEIGEVTLDEARASLMGVRGCGAVTRGDESSASLYLFINNIWVDICDLNTI